MITSNAVHIAVTGVTGRMGSAIIRSVLAQPDMQLAAAVHRPGSEAIDRDAGELAGAAAAGVPVQASGAIGDLCRFHVLIDFSRPDMLAANLALCVQRNAGIVVGTTGLSASDNAGLSEASAHIPVLVAANTSVGVNLCLSLVETASRVLGRGFDIEIVETHHRHKVDAPSGTALLLGEAAAAGRELNYPDCGVFARQGHTGERADGEIGFAAIRGGEVAGEHTVHFIGADERIEITHRASDRGIFADGAVVAARWLHQQGKGLYAMSDVLDLGAQGANSRHK